MQVRIVHLLISLFVGAVVACGASTRRGDQASAPTEASGVAAGDASAQSLETLETTDLTTNTETPEVQPAAPASSVGTPPSKPLISGTRHQDLPAYVVPEPIRQRLQETHPELLPPKSLKFQISKQHLSIDVDHSRITFNGLLHIAGRADEAIELACGIDKSQVPWECSDMFPTNERVAAQKRLQGTFECLDAYECDDVGVKIFVVIDGKLQAPQTFQAQGFSAHVATSGDEEEGPANPPSNVGNTAPSGPNSSIKKLEKVTPAAPSQTAPIGNRPKFQNRVSPEEDASGDVGAPVTSPVIATPPQRAKSSPLQPDPSPQKPHVTPEVQAPRPADPDNSEPRTPRPSLSGAALDEVLKDRSVAVEVTAPMNLPAPSKGKFSIPGIEKLNPPMGNGVTNQAIGRHDHGHLLQANELPTSGPGFVSRDHGSMDFATDMTVFMLKKATANVDKVYPGHPPFVIGAISKRNGGYSGHLSHQTGLDMDVGFPSTSNQRLASFWDACTRQGDGCPHGANIRNDLDEKRLWLFLKQMTCAQNNPVIAMFLDREIKHHLCQYVQTTTDSRDRDRPGTCAYRTLQGLYHAAGHHNHVHVRLVCPGNRDCIPSTVYLGPGNGC